MNCSMPSFSVLHYLLEFAQTHIHWVSDTIQPSHPLLPPSPLASLPASGSSQMNWLFASGGQSIGASASASELPMNIQGWFPLGLAGLISLLSKDSQESSPAPQFKSINFLALSLLYGPTLTSIHGYWKNHSFDYSMVCEFYLNKLFLKSKLLWTSPNFAFNDIMLVRVGLPDLASKNIGSGKIWISDK